MNDFQALQQSTVVNTYVNRQLTLVEGHGCFLMDQNGQKYLDLMSNYGVNILGYDHPEITAALAAQVQRLMTLHSSFTSDVRAQASEQLLRACDFSDGQVYWSNSGAEAIEAALKFIVLATGKKKFIVCDHGYHGKTLGALSATAGEKYKAPFAPLLWDFVQIPFNDAEALAAAIDDQTAAFFVEPIQGEGGIYRPDPSYLQRVREICTEKKVLLVIDEIQTGMGRTGTLLASQTASVRPDILCLGKGLAGGIPVGATLVSKMIATSIPKHIHTSTFGGNPLACAGVIATLRVLDEMQLAHVKEMSAYFRSQLASLTTDLVTDIRGEGLMIGLVVKDKRNQLLKLLQDRFVLAIPAGEDVIRLLPPLIIQKEEIDLAIAALQSSFATLV